METRTILLSFIMKNGFQGWFTLENKGNTILGNVRNYPPNNTVSHPRSLEVSATHNLKSYST